MGRTVFYFILLLLVSISFFQCRNVSRQDEDELLKPDSIKYRIVYYIHGDGSYLYHDNAGNGIQADERILQQAISVAEGLPNSEVFIFHQKPKKHFLFFFPLKDGEFYFFRNGQMVDNESYNSNPSLLNLDIEAAFFRENAAYVQNLPGRTVRNFFLYYGHEIPATEGRGYNASYPEKPFSIDNLANAMKLFEMMPQMDDSKFDFLLLSTCYNGTPGVISRLSPYASYIMASPEYLHLSYINSDYLKKLPETIKNGDLHQYLKNFAEKAFINLKSNTLTMITISLYDCDKVKSFLAKNNFLRGENRKTQEEETGSAPRDSKTAGCVDCLRVASFDLKAARQGIDLYYSPPQFGKYKDKLTHSGWGCPGAEK